MYSGQGAEAGAFGAGVGGEQAVSFVQAAEMSNWVVGRNKSWQEIEMRNNKVPLLVNVCVCILVLSV